MQEFTVLPANIRDQKTDMLDFTKRLTIDNPCLWSAEYPNLYKLNLSLIDGDRVLQKYTERIGIRELSWENGILKLNGSPLKLRGVNHHDLSPVNGRAISDVELLEDLILMQKGNINLVRTAHYPPQPRLLELCDSLGMYVIDEVPIGYGDELLTDSTYLPILLRRAKATVDRDKNRPSVIIWSVGNENPLTDICITTGRYVKRLDKTRPYLFAQTPTVFKNMIKDGIPDSIDMLDYHYPLSEDIKEYAPIVKHPWIASEYAHSMGLDAGHLEAIYETIYKTPTMAGGAIWMFSDQGLLRESKSKSENEPTSYAWASKDSIYDSNNIQGTDGIVYANRVPQVDYWEVRKVYTPVKALDDTLEYKSGRQNYNIRVNNRYDFINLKELDCKWQLLGDTTVLDSDIMHVSCEPHDTVTIGINTVLPEQPSANYYYIRLMFENREQYQVYEKVYQILSPQKTSFLNRLIANKKGKIVKSDSVVVSDKYSFNLVKDFSNFQIKNKKGNIIISEGLYAKVGRKPSLSERASKTSKRSKHLHTLWDQHLLSAPKNEIKDFNSNHLLVNSVYMVDSVTQKVVEGEIEYRFSDEYVDINYSMLPKGDGESVEAGVSFLIPASFTEFRWIGKGPYEAYPGKERLSEFGFYHISSEDLYFPGNRQNVDCAIFSDKRGNGFALIADRANISVERSEKGIVVSHNAFITGRWNKYTWPTNMLDFKDGKILSGKFTIVPLTENWPSTICELFGNPTKVAVPFKPFYDSYDQ